MTRLLVLGVLEEQPMSGYDIQQLLRMMDAERWGGVLVGSIYHALKKLEQEKHIELMSVEQTGHRQKAVYQITRQGKEHIKELVVDALRSPVVIHPSTLYSGLSFIDKISGDAAREALVEHRRMLDDEYRALEAGLKGKEAAMGKDIPPMIRLAFENMFSTIKQQQTFIERALEILE